MLKQSSVIIHTLGIISRATDVPSTYRISKHTLTTSEVYLTISLDAAGSCLFPEKLSMLEM